ncbi:NAD(P)-dependent oxidoreductase [Phytohabitans aurantiacus]|uniref:NAD(P)-binding domain-containing protein n=1 Tax=Phytohabitans aurantiacus TaxID=3016789 RepID=A0ABQ5RBD3_9ACTN|nr:NAD(P)H-binding protein [Phytohabitans aurantiacus]GLI03926.1 hypothetical protein Pa4123_92070 [Phytohabitans aurantiacus]
MSKIAIFGAGGRAGRHAVREAQARGHEVTAVVRDPSRYTAMAGERVTVIAGDVTDRGGVAAAADGHDAAIGAVYDATADPEAFYVAAADALSRADVGRLLVVTIGTLLEVAPGVRLLDAPEFPAEYRPFCLGHAAGVDVLRAAPRPWTGWPSARPATSTTGECAPEATAPAGSTPTAASRTPTLRSRCSTRSIRRSTTGPT